MVELIPYVKEHMDRINLRAHEQANFSKDLLHSVYNINMSFTLLDGEKIICLACHTRNATGFVEVFITPSCDVKSYALRFQKMCKAYIKRIEEDTPKFRRMETRSLANEATDRWMESLGFTCEGTHRNYAPDGSDYRTWARVRA
jgi:hypothetical protein